MVVKIKVKVFWVVMPRDIVVGYHHFRGPCCLHLQVAWEESRLSYSRVCFCTFSPQNFCWLNKNLIDVI
jgi:hypothetical protein